MSASNIKVRILFFNLLSNFNKSDNKKVIQISNFNGKNKYLDRKISIKRVSVGDGGVSIFQFKKMI